MRLLLRRKGSTIGQCRARLITRVYAESGTLPQGLGIMDKGN